MELTSYILIALALLDIVLATKHIISIIKSKNPDKKIILRNRLGLVIKTTSSYLGNYLLIIYCLINLSKM